MKLKMKYFRTRNNTNIYTVAAAAAVFSEPLLDIMPLPDPLCLLKPLTLPGPVRQNSMRNLRVSTLHFTHFYLLKQIIPDRSHMPNSLNVSAVTHLRDKTQS